MKKVILFSSLFCVAFLLGSMYKEEKWMKVKKSMFQSNEPMTNRLKLGAFSLSLVVKDIDSSYQFYSNLGFKVLGGDIKKKYLILKSESTLIGLFEGMISENMLTFNPGWNDQGKNSKSYTDIRIIYHSLLQKGALFLTKLTGEESGPAYFMLKDPDGNVLLFDQHI